MLENACMEKEPQRLHQSPQRRFQYAGPYNSYAEYIATVEGTNRIEHGKQYGLKDSLTPCAKQLNWKTLTEFPLTPQEISNTPLQDYLALLSKGTIYCRN